MDNSYSGSSRSAFLGAVAALAILAAGPAAYAQGQSGASGEEADLDEDHGGTNQAILEVALQEGYGNERAGWPLEYCGKIAVQMIGNFYDGVYRRFA